MSKRINEKEKTGLLLYHKKRKTELKKKNKIYKKNYRLLEILKSKKINLNLKNN
jgi:hypothetical protein